MKFQNLAVLVALTSSVAFAADGPTVKIDESRYDMAGKQEVDTGNVFHPITKSMSVRTVYLVKERPDAPRTAYIVRETEKVSKTIREDQEYHVLVEQKDQTPTAKWQYKVK